MALGLSLGAAFGETVAYWRFEDNGDSQANAASFALELSPSVQFAGEVPGATILCDGQKLPNRYSYANGKSEEGTKLPASDQLEQLIGMGSFTIEGFLRLSDGAAKEQHMRIIGDAYYRGSPGGWSIGVTSGKLVFSALQELNTTDESAPTSLISTKALTESAWHHFAVVGYRNADALVIRLFIDGEETEVERKSNFYAAAPGGPAIKPNKDPYIISAKNIFLGELDELRISDVALDPSEFLTVSP